MSSKSKKLVCGVDSSLNSTGICILDYDTGKIVHCESINPSPLISCSRLNYIYERYLAIFNSFPEISIIGFERQVSQQRYNWNAKYILDLAEGFGVFKLAMYQISLSRDLRVYHFTAQDLKIYATDNGKATKDDMISSMPKRTLSKIESFVLPSALDDAVDAYYAAQRTRTLLRESSLEDQINYLYYAISVDESDQIVEVK